MTVTAPEATPGAEPQNTPEPSPEPAAAPQAGSEPTPAPEPQGNGQEPSQGATEPASVDQLPPWAQKLIRDTRNEAAANRAKAKEHSDTLAQFRAEQETQRSALAKALGLAPEEVTPEQLAAERDAERARAEQAAQRARQGEVRLAVLQQAFASQADGNALLDSVGFLRTVDGLDPSADDFSERVKDAIAAAVESNARYRLDAGPPAPPPPPPPPVQQIPASTPGPVGSPAPGPRQWTDEDVARATPAELTKAMEQGLLENLGFGRTHRKAR